MKSSLSQNLEEFRQVHRRRALLRAVQYGRRKSLWRMLRDIWKALAN